jgi:LuxR family maltose regulon positive regulatory protein
MNASRFVRLHRWLALLPKKDVAEAPLLATTQAFIGIELGLDADAYMFTETAIRMLAALSPQSEMHPRLQAEVMVLQGFADLFIDDAHNCIVHAKSALHALPEHMEYIRSLGIGVLSVCHQMKGESDHAIAVTREALADTTLIVNMEARLHFYQCLVHYMDGDLNNMMNAARRCLQAIGNVPFHHTRTFADYFLGTAYYLQNQPGEAETCLSKVFADRHAANPSYVAHACIILASIYFSRGEETAVERVIEQISIHCRENDYAIPLSTIQAFEVEIALRRGDIRQANQMCKQTDFETRPPIWFHYAPQLTPIKCLLAEGTEDGLKKARTRLIEWEERMSRINRVNVRIEILALMALVCHKQRDEAAALEHLQTALALAEPGGWSRIFVDLGVPMMDLLKCLIQYKPGQTYAQQVLKACKWEHRKIAHPEPDETTKPRISEQPPHNLLTPREIEILPLLAEGLSNKEIAARLYIAPLTVKTHLQNIYKKLNVKNRIEALEKAREIGIINNK